MAKQANMFDLRTMPVLKVLAPFAGGIFAGRFLDFPVPAAAWLIPLVLACPGLVVLFIRLKRRSALLSWLFCLWVFLLCLLAGMGSGRASRPVDPGLPVGDWVLISGQVKEVSGPSRLRCAVVLQHLYKPDTVYQCKTLLQVYLDPRDDAQLPLPGETWQWLGMLAPIRNSGNPGSTDFESIMHRKDCWYRFYAAGPGDPFRHGRKIQSGKPWANAELIRNFLSASWHGEEEEVALLKAVCLGDRTSLTEDMRQFYGTAGGMHLLAVSGLHVGLIWWVLQRATQWMVRKARGEAYRTVVVVGILWVYAALTGFSSSVCRSVTMFSFFSAGRMLGQRTRMLNGLFVSALILLVLEPSRLMEPGFQLSYAAMLGIASFYPFLRKLVKPKYRISRWLWEAAAVSLAAQMLTAPLVIYYFHQLPLYSMLASILAIPMLSLLIALFTCSVPFMIAGIFDNTFSFLLTFLAGLMNLTMEWVSDLPGALLEEMHLSAVMLILLLILLSLAMLSLHCRSRSPVYLLLLVSSAAVFYGARTLASRQRTSQLVIGHFRGASMVIFREGIQVDHFCFHSDSSSLARLQDYRSEAWSKRRYRNRLHVVGDSLCIRGSVAACIQMASGVWSVGNDQLKGWVVTQALSVKLQEPSPGTSGEKAWSAPDFILVSSEPFGLNLETMPLGPYTDLVVDGSSRTWYRKSMHEHPVPIHDTEWLGAYMKRW